MATMTCKMTKKSSGTKASAKASAAASVVGFNLQDNGDATFTVFGTDAAGAQLDISGVAKLTAVSDNPAVITVDAPVGMTSAIHAPTAPAPTPGQTANVTLTATWNDGSVGPFTIVWPISITTGGPTGIMVSPGTPTVH